MDVIRDTNWLYHLLIDWDHVQSEIHVTQTQLTHKMTLVLWLKQHAEYSRDYNYKGSPYWSRSVRPVSALSTPNRVPLPVATSKQLNGRWPWWRTQSWDVPTTIWKPPTRALSPKREDAIPSNLKNVKCLCRFHKLRMRHNEIKENRRGLLWRIFGLYVNVYNWLVRYR